MQACKEVTKSRSHMLEDESFKRHVVFTNRAKTKLRAPTLIHLAGRKNVTVSKHIEANVYCSLVNVGPLFGIRPDIGTISVSQTKKISGSPQHISSARVQRLEMQGGGGHCFCLE